MSANAVAEMPSIEINALESMTMVSDADLDEAIISFLSKESLKTAMIIYLVGEKFSNTNSEFFDMIEKRISYLIETDRIKLYGTLSKWRSSELSLK
ncbi:hypothetical protein [Bosea vaviloviae]|uniref:hypothetical protein n=1 Tax=Bosea vaviloviae TaxID=1526658 RepID=UPI0011DF4418|nr:hypothetical protein [Bosea vaviloviae]